MATPTCPECQRVLEGGFLLDHTHGGHVAARWVEGPPERTFWGTLRLRGRRQLTVYAWRGPGCSQVRLFAPDG